LTVIIDISDSNTTVWKELKTKTIKPTDSLNINHKTNLNITV